MKLNAEQEEELRELLEHHEQYSDCMRDGGCCASDLIEFLREVMADA